MLLFLFIRFDNLKKDNVTILEGKRLSEALDNQPVSSTCIELETEIQELQNIKDGLINQKQLYINQLNIIKYEFFLNQILHKLYNLW